ncbi:DUF1439 domain-containing protein [Aestuariibacter sp. GS-14]|uniref:DUF1439 domain-containing protein n=1 Tax=Aestuariibacter sp. GS-14 TaxID=2590670 RepID=UPI001127587A|nr:DUF1439 domain-containing protein [Aestuariibacter sp. GS-14]TPV60716.1 DUF1439 domain-containing protein [Aestuariibacter sp. GS-14]
MLALSQLSWQDKLHVLVGYCLLKTGRLTFDAFSEAELNDIVRPYFPVKIPLEVPIGEGSFECLEGQLTMPVSTNRLTLQLFCAVEIRALGSAIYRAHVAVSISALPNYYPASRTLRFTDVKVDVVHLLNDRYSLIKDTQFIIDKLIPGPLSGLSSLLGQPIRSALSIVTAGSTEHALAYLQLYLQGNTQRILDFHKPKIEQQLLRELETRAVGYTLSDNVWREFLFARWGKRVVVEEKSLRFYFTE